MRPEKRCGLRTSDTHREHYTHQSKASGRVLGKHVVSTTNAQTVIMRALRLSLKGTVANGSTARPAELVLPLASRATGSGHQDSLIRSTSPKKHRPMINQL